MPETAQVQRSVEKSELDADLFKRVGKRGGRFDKDLLALDVGEQLQIIGGSKLGIQGAIGRLRKAGDIAEDAKFKVVDQSQGNVTRVLVGRFS